MTTPPIYVLDTNVFIEASRRYYAFDIAPAFWRALVKRAEDGQLLSIDRVKDEIVRGNDELRIWASGDFHAHFASTTDPDIIDDYRRIIEWVHSQSQFNDSAKTGFADGADGWVVAYTITKDCVVVTHEQFNPDIRRKIPIPNVCLEFGVRYVDTFQLLRELGVRLT